MKFKKILFAKYVLSFNGDRILNRVVGGIGFADTEPKSVTIENRSAKMIVSVNPFLFIGVTFYVS